MRNLVFDSQNDLDQTNSGCAVQNSALSKQALSNGVSLTGRVTLDVNRWLIDRPIAHRGLHGQGRPENSMAAFSAAIEAGFPVELDVRLLRDSNIVVIHDRALQRLTGNRGVINALDTAALRKLRILGTDESIPTLDDVLDLVNGQIPVLIEIKGESLSTGSLERGTVQRLLQYNGPVAVQAFSPISVAAIQKLVPGIVCGQLVGTFSEIGALPHWTKTILGNVGASFLGASEFLACDLSGLSNAKINRLRKSGMPLLAWTVRSHADVQSACKYADNYIFEELPHLKKKEEGILLPKSPKIEEHVLDHRH